MLNLSIESIDRFNSNVNYHIIVNSDETVPGINKGKQYLYKLNEKFRERLNSKEGPTDRLNNSSYLKLFIPEILKDLDKCLFVDCDCVCFGPLNDVYNTDIQYLALSSINISAIKRKTELGINYDGNYYSTGIILMNLNSLRLDDFRNKCFKDMNTIPCSFWCHEETLINKNYYSKITQFDKTVQYFNREIHECNYNDYEKLRKNIPNIKFAHIGGTEKSLFYRLSEFSKEYSKFLKIQSLKNIISVDEFINNKKRFKVLIDNKHTQMRQWFSDYDIVNDANDANIAIFHGTNYFGSQHNIDYIDNILEHNLPIISIEDTFLRSIYPSRTSIDRKFKSSVGFCINNYLYFESNQLTTIKKLLSEKFNNNVNSCLAIGEKIINAILQKRISKYNCQQSIGSRDAQMLYKNCVLVVDQAFADQSIINSGADIETFKKMLIAAVKENPNSKICVKVHPESMTGGRAGFYTDDVIDIVEKITKRKIFKLTEPINPIVLLRNVKKVYTCSSGLGFEALMCRVPVVCFGAPFYAGFGLTDDRNENTKFIQNIPIEYMVYVVFERFSFFKHPETNAKMTTLEAINYLALLRDLMKK
jgi:lipopolysaccharide biosynthesis glycosyltransferase